MKTWVKALLTFAIISTVLALLIFLAVYSSFPTFLSDEEIDNSNFPGAAAFFDGIARIFMLYVAAFAFHFAYIGTLLSSIILKQHNTALMTGCLCMIGLNVALSLCYFILIDCFW
jgi:hypothetical protein